jgi:hypothetical protein
LTVENPFYNVGLTYIEVRLQELADNLPYEVDLDTDEVLHLQEAILLCETEMTAERAFQLKKNLDEIERFVEDQKEALQSLLHGVSVSKSGRGQYGQHKSKVRSRFVYRKA